VTTLALDGAAAAPTAGAGKWAIAIAVSLGALLEIVDMSIVNVALPQMQASLGATLAQVSWVITSYGIANVIILPLSAWLGHRFGKKTYFVFSLVGFVVASVLCGISTSLPMLIIARLLQGFTGGGLLAKAQAILLETFPPEEQAIAQGLFGAIVIAGPAIGPTLGGYLVTNYDWRSIFFINVPLGIVATFMVTSLLPKDDERAKENSPIDWLSIALLAIGLGSLQTFLEEGNSEDWFESNLVIALAIASVVGIAAFVYRELHAEHPVVGLRVLRHRSLAAGSVLGVVIGMSLYGALFSVPIYAQTVLGFTSQQTGMLLLPGALVSAMAMQVASRLARKYDSRIILVAGGGILVLALHWLSISMTPTGGADDLFWPLIVRAFGTVLMFLPLQLAALGPIPKDEIAHASGVFNLMRQLGGSIGIAILTFLLDERVSFHHDRLAEHLSATDPAALGRVNAYASTFLAQGDTPALAHQKGLAMLDVVLGRQAAVMSFSDTFVATSVLVLASLALVFLFKKTNPGAPVVTDGH